MANETFDFKAWILKHSNDEYRMTLENDQLIMLRTDYGEASIQFTEIEENTIVEFKITFDKDHSVKFYLHFELNDENHAKQLYDEMVETLIGLKDQKTLKVLLSCSAGLTTSMFAENLNSVAEMLGLDYHFDAVSYLSLYEEVQNYDIVFIAPQIGYMYNRLKESLPDKLVLQIPTSLFASYDALGAIQFIQQEFKNIEKQAPNIDIDILKKVLPEFIKVLPEFIQELDCQYQLSYDKKIGLIMHLSGVICSLVDNAPIPKKYNYKNIISTHKKTYEYLYDLVEMIEEPFHIQFSDSDIASLITIIKEI